MSEPDSAPDFAAQNQVTALVRERKDVLTVRWLAATAAIGALAIVLALIAQTIPVELPKVAVVVAWLIGSGLALASVLVPRRMMGEKLIAARLRSPVDAYRCAVQMKLSAGNKDVFIALPPSEQGVCALTLMFERPYTLGLGLAFGVALVGFVYGLVSQTLLEAAPFLLTALALMCWHYPRLTGLIDRGRAVLKADQDQEALRALEDIQQQQQQQEKHAQEAAPRPQRKSRTGERPPGTGTQKP